MTCLVARGLSIDLQILDNKAGSTYKEAITFKWNATFQLVPLDMHHCNWAERNICTFKDHFLAILAGIHVTFPPYLWDLLLPQAELFFQRPFNFNKMPLGPVGCPVLLHAKPAT
jgi:hypothetical protein